MITTPSNVTRVCQNLAKQGLVERHRSETSDREVVARLTPEGQKAFDALFPVVVGFTTGFIDELLTTAEQRQVGDLLMRLCNKHAERAG